MRGRASVHTIEIANGSGFATIADGISVHTRGSFGVGRP
jgi:hypothetical protein